MAAQVPPKLKAADLTRFIVRASQLQTVKPVVAYWCEYWIVNQILAKGLHNGDEDTLKYTTDLMDKLEQIKAENPTNDAIIDDTAGQAYVEQFALETFQRADKTVQANKVSKQTADTFQAAATFFELVNIWGPPDSETQAKIKYAKWNAVRIVKALKEGVDPNESNPKPEPGPEEDLPTLDPNDPEVQQLGEEPNSWQASVEEVPDEQDRVDANLAHQSILDRSLHPSAQVSARGSPRTNTYEPYPRSGFPYSAVQDDNVSPLEPSPPPPEGDFQEPESPSTSNPRNGSIGGGYFPEVPTFTSESRDATLQTAPLNDALDPGLPDHPSASSGAPTISFGNLPHDNEGPAAPSSPQDFYQQAPSQHVTSPSHAPPPAAPSAQTTHPGQPSVSFAPPPVQPQFPSQTQHFQQPPRQPTYPPVQPVQPVQQTARQSMKNAPLNTDDVAIAKAQKHARWAISALNFEDADTAVRELRAALQTLGASN